MELISLIKMALLIFTVVVAIIVVTSYIIYKFRESKSSSKPVLAPIPVRADNRRSDNIYKKDYIAAYNEQQNMIHFRNTQNRKLTLKSRPKKERFLVVNPVIPSINDVSITEKASYHPSINAKMIDLSPNGNLFDRYSASTERLSKLYVA